MMASESYTDAEAAPLIGSGGGVSGGRRRPIGRTNSNNKGGASEHHQFNNGMNNHNNNSYDTNQKSTRRSRFFQTCFGQVRVIAQKCETIIPSSCNATSFCCCSPFANLSGMTKKGSTKNNQTTTTYDMLNYYEDTYNDQPWECTFGTSDQDGIWVNHSDQVGTIMSSMVWILIVYSMLTIDLLAASHHLPTHIAVIYETICGLALASHAKTMFTDPGSIPQQAVPLPELFQKGITTHAMCSHCQTYKPPSSHHCRICNRCISRMDHHCPWMNNCVGAGNMKHFILFLCYTWTGCAFALLIFACNYFFCNSQDCQFSPVLMQLVRVMTLLCIGTLLFVSSMLMNVIFGIMTGIGTIDRLKKKANDTYWDSDEMPIHLKDVFGIQGYWTWIFPIDPIFDDYDTVMGYSVPQRLIRESQMTKTTTATGTATEGGFGGGGGAFATTTTPTNIPGMMGTRKNNNNDGFGGHHHI